MKNVVFIDAETTGFDTQKDEILQLTILAENGDKLFNEFIRPTKNTSWPEAEKYHHITCDMVADALTIDSYAKVIQRILDKADVIVGYNHSFDMAFLENAGIHSDQKKNYDLMLEFSQLKGDWDTETNNYKWYKLKECADYYGYDWGTEATHDSLADARAILFCYKKMVSGVRAGEKKAGEIKTGEKKVGTVSKSVLNALYNASRMPRLFKACIAVIGCLAIIVLLFVGKRMFSSKPTGPDTDILPSIIKLLDRADLATMQYTYNSIVTVKDEKDKVKYYVSYEGNVKAGVDFTKIAKDISFDKNNKTVTIKLPEVKVQDANVEVGSLDFLFVKDKYDTNAATPEAYQLCVEDLKKAVKDHEMLDAAKENAKTTIRALLVPWLESDSNIIFK